MPSTLSELSTLKSSVFGSTIFTVHTDLHHTSYTWEEDKEKGGVLANLVVRQGALALQLLVGKDEALPTLWKPICSLSLVLYVVNSI